MEIMPGGKMNSVMRNFICAIRLDGNLASKVTGHVFQLILNLMD